MNEPQHLLTVQNRLGETPIWYPQEKALYWVDWGGRPSCRLDPATGQLTTFPVDTLVTALARRASGGWLAIAQDGIQRWDPATNAYEPFVFEFDAFSREDFFSFFNSLQRIQTKCRISPGLQIVRLASDFYEVLSKNVFT